MWYLRCNNHTWHVLASVFCDQPSRTERSSVVNNQEGEVGWVVDSSYTVALFISKLVNNIYVKNKVFSRLFNCLVFS